MAKRCEICLRGPSTTFKVSHAHNRSKRRVFLNLQSIKIQWKGRAQRMKVCTKCLKSGKVKKATK